jgi:hypothetical protein
MTPHTRRTTAARITCAGRTWYDPKGGQTSWQRERERGRVEPMDGSEHLGSILWPALIAMLVIVGCFWIMANGWSW